MCCREEPAQTFNLTQAFRDGLIDRGLYDMTRGVWKVRTFALVMCGTEKFTLSFRARCGGFVHMVEDKAH
jgi:hypothetical protein